MEWAAQRFRRDCGGATAIELAFVLPVAIMMIVGTINVGILASVINSMNFAVEEAARCSAVNVALCGTAEATVTYAGGKYRGPGEMPKFEAGSGACGRTVTATHDFELSYALGSVTIPLTATACFPAVAA